MDVEGGKMEPPSVPRDGAVLGEDVVSTPALLDPLLRGSLLQGLQNIVFPEVKKRDRKELAREALEDNKYMPPDNFHPSKTPGSRVTPRASRRPKIEDSPSPNKGPKKKLRCDASEDKGEP